MTRGSVAAVIVLFGACLLVASQFWATDWALYIAALGVSLIMSMGLLGLPDQVWHWMQRQRVRRLSTLIRYDDLPCFISDDSLHLLHCNPAAVERAGGSSPPGFDGLFDGLFAAPMAVLWQLRNRAEKSGQGSADAFGQRGPLRLTVQRLPYGLYLWRLQDQALGPAADQMGAGVPMLTVGRGDAVLFMNAAAMDLCGGQVDVLGDVFPNGTPKSGRFAVVRTETGPRNCLVTLWHRSEAHLEVYFLPMTDGDGLHQGGLDDGAMDLLPLAILRLDRDGCILAANRAAQELLQIDPADVNYLGDVLEGPGRSVRDWLSLALDNVAPTKSEFLRVRQKDNDLFVQASLCHIEQSDGRRLLAVLSDATQIKTLEDQFAQSQKMQAIGELAGGVAHDFNNLLTAISGHCDLLLRHRDEGDVDFADLMQIRQNSNRAASLVGQLLAFSRKQTLRPEVLDLREVLADLAHLMNRLVGERVSVALNVDPLIDNIRADRRQLEQVMINLVVNARDAMDGQGLINVTAGNHMIAACYTRDQVTVPAGDYLIIEVEDAGCGIQPEVLQKIFEPFFTTKALGEGTGLGLATVYGIVKQSGGFVFVDSMVGEGTRFTLLFPAVFEPISTADAPVAHCAAQSVETGTVLLVEDEAPVRAFAVRALELAGLSVIVADCAEQALELLSDPAVQVDMFLTDVVMPGLDGPSWVREAQKKRPDIPVVFMSGYAEDVLTGTRDDFETAAFLPKPFTLEELTDVVRKNLH
ncbi:ATP-binding protein [Thalassobius sp. Cn5-15]|nr:ATP-binding protein [Thalassobius sp. Cn5-15]